MRGHAGKEEKSVSQSSVSKQPRGRRVRSQGSLQRTGDTQTRTSSSRQEHAHETDETLQAVRNVRYSAEISSPGTQELHVVFSHQMGQGTRDRSSAAGANGEMGTRVFPEGRLPGHGHV